MTETHVAKSEAAEIMLDTSKLLGFQTLATLGEGADDLRQAMEDTHNKVGEIPAVGASA